MTKLTNTFLLPLIRLPNPPPNRGEDYHPKSPRFAENQGEAKKICTLTFWPWSGNCWRRCQPGLTSGKVRRCWRIGAGTPKGGGGAVREQVWLLVVHAHRSWTSPYYNTLEDGAVSTDGPSRGSAGVQDRDRGQSHTKPECR